MEHGVSEKRKIARCLDAVDGSGNDISALSTVHDAEALAKVESGTHAIEDE